MDIETIHHVSLTASDLERSREFYREILGLDEIARPNFPFPGAWFRVGGTQQLHLIVNSNATFRGDKGIDTRDVHFAVRTSSYRQALQYLRSKGFREDAGDMDLRKMVVNPKATAGFPQIYIADPDRHVIEINAEKLD
ncbi:MAG TPA: VOC family protein [Bryobacteraceae bacterium]|nr:VOC family protein [Bryobacteraceae bacterium]